MISAGATGAALLEGLGGVLVVLLGEIIAGPAGGIGAGGGTIIGAMRAGAVTTGGKPVDAASWEEAVAQLAKTKTVALIK